MYVLSKNSDVISLNKKENQKILVRWWWWGWQIEQAKPKYEDMTVQMNDVLSYTNPFKEVSI